MSIAARLQQVRGAATRKEVAAHLGVHANSVANYEHGRDPPASYLTAIAERYGIRPEWLLMGRGPMREGEQDPSLVAEQLAYAVSAAIEDYYGRSLAAVNLELRARVLRAVMDYLKQHRVTEKTIPDRTSLLSMVKLTGGMLGVRRNKD